MNLWGGGRHNLVPKIPYFLRCVGKKTESWKGLRIDVENVEIQLLNPGQSPCPFRPTPVLKALVFGPGRCGSVGWASAHKPEGCRLAYWSEHMSRL